MKPSPARPAGYTRLVEQFDLTVVENWHTSAVARGNNRRLERDGNRVSEVYPASHWPGDSIGNHLEFALKYDGTNLYILAALFDVIPVDALVPHIEATPLGKYVRRLWYLYEWCTGRPLAVAAIARVGYIH